MSEAAVRRPPVPQPAERARTIASRGGRAVLLRSDSDHPERIQPHLHHVHADGTVTALLADDHPMLDAARAGRLPAMVEVADRAPVELREPVRALLWITGLLVALEPADAREQALLVAQERADSRLLDVGHGYGVLRLTPAALVLADSEGTCPLSPEEFRAATPDPFAPHEDNWLRHLDSAHRDVVGMLTRLLPEALRGGNVRPLGLDRYGLRLRIEAAGGDHDVRLAFSQPVDTPQGLAVELRRMVGCPFLARARER